MKHGEYHERLFIRCVGDQIILNRVKTKRARSQVRTDMPHQRKRRQRLHRHPDFVKNSVCGFKVICGNELPDFFEVSEGFWVEDKAAHGRRRSSLLTRRRLKASSLSRGFTWLLLISSNRPSSVFRVCASSARKPLIASSTKSSGARPVVAQSSL